MTRSPSTTPTSILTTPAADVVPHPALDQAVEVDAPVRRGVDPLVFGVAAVVSIAFVVWGLVSTDSLGTASGKALDWVMTNTGWLFVLTSSGFVVFVVWLAMSRYGTIPLGRDDEEPEFRTTSWIAMMFSAGMGIGLMFYGVSEPLSHFVDPPPGTGGDPDAAAQTAMATTMVPTMARTLISGSEKIETAKVSTRKPPSATAQEMASMPSASRRKPLM